MAKNKLYNGFINIIDSKDWKKYFSEKELIKLDRIFRSYFSEKSEINEEQSYIENLIRIKRIHPDSGLWDDTCGITPKRLKKSLKKNNFHIYDLVSILPMLEVAAIEHEGDYKEFSDKYGGQTFIDYDLVMKDYMPSKEKVAQFRVNRRKLREQRINIEIKNILSKIPQGYETYNSLSKKEKEVIYKEFLSTGGINFEGLLKDRYLEWEKIQGFKPKSIEMLAINPAYFNKKIFLGMLEKMKHSKQLSKLSVKDRSDFINHYLVFGNDLSEIPFDLLNSTELSMNIDLLSIHKGSNRVLNRILRNMSKGIIPDLSINKLALINYVLNTNKSIYDKFVSKKEIYMRDLEALSSISEYLSKLEEDNLSGVFKYIMNLSESELKKIFSCNYTKSLKFFMQNKDNDLNIPITSFNIGEYLFEVISKDDPRGLYAGYPFCCQHFDATGVNFVKYGYENNDSTFVIISKSGVLVAESWIWIKENQLTFDSLDKKGAINTEVLKEGYTKLAKFFIENIDKVDSVTIGSNQIFRESSKDFLKLTNTSAGNCYDSSQQYKIL